MYEWQRQIQMIVDEIDSCIKNYEDEALTLRCLSRRPVSYTHLDVYKRQNTARAGKTESVHR